MIILSVSATELLARSGRFCGGKVHREYLPAGCLSHGNLKIDFAHAEVFRNDHRVPFATEYRLLLQLAHNMGQVLTSEQLLTNVWGAEYREDKEILWVSISRLRQKLEDDPKSPQHIVTRSGLGYTMPAIQK
jgi:DNA-binding response OmpR family regulator